MMEEFELTNPELWVALAFVGFVAVMIYVKVPKLIAKMLDERSEGIAKQLDEARRLREEAQTLLASWQRKQRQANEEAADIVRQAETAAKRTAEETREQLEESLKRREEQSADKISQAQARAVKEVKSVAVDVATEVARRIIAEQVDKKAADKLFEESVDALDKTLH